VVASEFHSPDLDRTLKLKARCLPIESGITALLFFEDSDVVSFNSAGPGRPYFFKVLRQLADLLFVELSG